MAQQIWDPSRVGQLLKPTGRGRDRRQTHTSWLFSHGRVTKLLHSETCTGWSSTNKQTRTGHVITSLTWKESKGQNNLLFSPYRKEIVIFNDALNTFNFMVIWYQGPLRLWNKKGRKEGNVLFNNTLNTFYLWLYGVGHMVNDRSDSKSGTRCHHYMGYTFLISSKHTQCNIPHTG